MKKKSHTTLGDNALRCLNCGEQTDIQMPVSIGIMAAMAKAFDVDHRQCKPSAKGKARVEGFTTAEQWLAGWDTGLSSLTIWHFMHRGIVMRPTIPYDVADFGRCYRLLLLFPEWRQRLDKMGETIPMWKPFVAAWPEMERLFIEGEAPKLYAFIQTLVVQSHDTARGEVER